MLNIGWDINVCNNNTIKSAFYDVQSKAENTAVISCRSSILKMITSQSVVHNLWGYILSYKDQELFEFRISGAQFCVTFITFFVLFK